MFVIIDELAESSKAKYKINVVSGATSHSFTVGARGYNDYTLGASDKDKRAYLARASYDGGITTAGFWARWLLWHKKTIHESINSVEFQRELPANVTIILIKQTKALAFFKRV